MQESAIAWWGGFGARCGGRSGNGGLLLFVPCYFREGSPPGPLDFLSRWASKKQASGAERDCYSWGRRESLPPTLPSVLCQVGNNDGAVHWPFAGEGGVVGVHWRICSRYDAGGKTASGTGPWCKLFANFVNRDLGYVWQGESGAVLGYCRTSAWNALSNVTDNDDKAYRCWRNTPMLQSTVSPLAWGVTGRGVELPRAALLFNEGPKTYDQPEGLARISPHARENRLTLSSTHIINYSRAEGSLDEYEPIE